MSHSIGRVLKNFGFLISASIVSKAILAVVAIYLARILGPTGFGIIAFAQAVVSYFTLVTDLGLKTTAMRELAHAEKKADYQSTIFSTRLILTVFSVCAFVVFLMVFSFDQTTKAVLIVYGSLIVVEGMFVDWIFMSREKTSYVAIAELVKNFVYAGLLYLLLRQAVQITFIPISYGVATFLALVVLYSFLFGFRLLPRLDWRPQNIWSILKLTLPLGMTQILITLYYNLDHILLGFLKTKEMVGFYNAPYKLINLGSLVLNLFINSAIPFLTRLYTHKQQDYCSLINIGTIMSLLLFFPLGFLVTFFSQEIIGVLFGSLYMTSVDILKILIWSLVIMGTRLLFENFLIISGAQRRYLRFACIYFLSNLALNLILIPSYGGIGAAIATVGADLVFVVVQVTFAPKQFFAHHKFFGICMILVTLASVFLLNHSYFDRSTILVNTLVLYSLIIFFFYRSVRDGIHTLLFRIART